MYDHIEFTPDGLIVQKWSVAKQKNIRKRPKKLTILTHLRSHCEIAEGTTLRQIFDAVDKYKLLKLVVSQYSWCRDIDKFHAQARESKRNSDNQAAGHYYDLCDSSQKLLGPLNVDDSEIEYLEIHHYSELHKLRNTQEKDFETFVGFTGIGAATKDYPSNRPDGKVSYAVSYSPMWELADLPVKLNKSLNVSEPWESGKHNRNKLPEKILTATRQFTLLEVLDAIYWDISFMGGPQDNANFLEEMKETVEEIKNGLPMIPIEQVFTDMKEDPDKPEQEGKMKILLHPDVAKMLGCDPNSIPLDDKEIIRDNES